MRFSKIINVAALGFFVVYVLSNVTLLQSAGVLYYLKHLGMIGIAAIAGVWWLWRGKTTALGRYALFFSALLVLSLPYAARFALTRDPVEFLVFVQLLIFATAVIALSFSLEHSSKRGGAWMVGLLLGSVTLIALISGLVAPQLLYNTYWGRPRLLLGFWHPKEVSLLIATATLLVLTRAVLRVRPFFNGVLYVLLLNVLFLVQSRNSFLFALFVGMSYLCATYLGYSALLLGVALVSIGAVWFVATYPVLADLLLSGRLTLWTSVDYSLLGSGTSIGGGPTAPGSKFHIDSFYLEYVYENGLYALVLLLALALIVTYIVRYTPDPRWRRLKISVALAMFSVSLFDAGMFSTGNFLNIAVWVYLLAGERILAVAPRVSSLPFSPAPSPNRSTPLGLDTA